MDRENFCEVKVKQNCLFSTIENANFSTSTKGVLQGGGANPQNESKKKVIRIPPFRFYIFFWQEGRGSEKLKKFLKEN
jgi:hypothetical protein